MDETTSVKKSRLLGSRLKKSIYLSYSRPATTQLSISIPIGSYLCPNCQEDTNTHIGFCSSHTNSLITLLSKYKKILYDILSINAIELIHNLMDQIDRSVIFSYLINSLAPSFLTLQTLIYLFIILFQMACRFFFTITLVL